MKLINENYCCTVVKINSLLDLEGLDNLKAFPIFGFQALVNKDYEVGQLYLLFTAECQLNNEFCKQNNLYAHEYLNADPEVKGYLGDKCRIKAIRLRGHVSNALVLPISSLSYLGDVSLKEGDSFNEINGVKIVDKYEIIQRSSRRQKQVGQKRISLLSQKSIPEHFDTSHWGRNEHKVNDDTVIVVSHKLHGSSFRAANQQIKTYPKRILKWLNHLYKKGWGNYKFVKLLEKFSGKIVWKPIAASRRVIKLIDLDETGYYDLDIWNQELEKIAHLIPKNWVIYGEIIGWVGNKPIQKNYTYNLPIGEHSLYVYRVAIVNEDGHSFDLPQKDMEKWCNSVGLKICPVIFVGRKGDFDYTKYMDMKYFESGMRQCIPLSKDSPVDEGVVIRVEDGMAPVFYKAKSPIFLGHETKELDEGVVSLEDLES
jgi:hypothetical protein